MARVASNGMELPSTLNVSYNKKSISSVENISWSLMTKGVSWASNKNEF